MPVLAVDRKQRRPQAGARRRALIRHALRWALAAWLLALPLQAFNSVSDALSPINNLPRFALVVGNSRYSEAPLKNPANDANAIAEQLRRLGFTVTLKLDAGRQELVDAIQSFGNSLAKQKGVGLFYFAGHGAQLAWRNYLIPVDAVIEQVSDMQTRAVDVGTLLNGLSKAGNPMNVVILDACRDNPFGKARVEQKGLSQLDAPPGTLLAYATSPGNVAADGEGKNGLYTAYLLREMQAREAKIEDIFKRVRLNVRRESQGRQIPWESTSLEEDFYFMPPAQIKKLTPEEIERQFEEELGIWEKIKGAKDVAPLEDYLRRFPSGRFSELAQFRLDRLLAQQEKPVQVALVAPAPSSLAQKPAAPVSAEADRKRQEELARAEAELKKQQELAKAQADRKRQEEPARAEPATPAPIAAIHVASIAPNPYSRGTVSADPNYKIGDRYSYQVIDTLTKLETGKFTRRVTGITDTEVIYGNGRIITDLLGNYIREPNGNEPTGQQLYVAEYRVGKKWTTRYRFRRPVDGNYHDVEYDFKVVARENITVPAGTFDAFKVEGRGFNIGQGTQLTYVYWIDPDKVRLPIAWEFIARNKFGKYTVTNRNELVSYRQSN